MRGRVGSISFVRYAFTLAFVADTMPSYIALKFVASLPILRGVEIYSLMESSSLDSIFI